MKKTTRLKLAAALTGALALTGIGATAALADAFDGTGCVKNYYPGGWIGSCNIEGAPGTPTSMARVAGDDRYATAALVSQDAFDPGVPVVYLVNGYSTADALGAGPAARGDGPVLLVPATGTLPAVVASELARLDPVRVVAVGGVSAVSDSILGQAVEAARN